MALCKKQRAPKSIKSSFLVWQSMTKTKIAHFVDFVQKFYIHNTFRQSEEPPHDVYNIRTTEWSSSRYNGMSLLMVGLRCICKNKTGILISHLLLFQLLHYGWASLQPMSPKIVKLRSLWPSDRRAKAEIKVKECKLPPIIVE